MKRRIKEILKIMVASIASVGIFGAVLWGVNHFTLNALTNGYITLSPAVGYVTIPGSTIPLGFDSPNITVTDITFRNAYMLHVGEVDFLVMSAKEAAEIGAQYIWDIFGESIDGMYVEVELSHWFNVNRPHWHGMVSVYDRRTLEQREERDRLIEEYNLRRLTGERLEDIREIFTTSPDFIEYNPAMIYFTIDAITGERIDISRPIDAEKRGMDLAGYWGSYEARMAHTVEFTTQQMDELMQIARNLGQAHFSQSTVVGVQFIHAWRQMSSDMDGNIFVCPGFADFEVRDDIGRIAVMNFCLDDTEVTNIRTVRNDIRPAIFPPFDWVTIAPYAQQGW